MFDSKIHSFDANSNVYIIVYIIPQRIPLLKNYESHYVLIAKIKFRCPTVQC